MNLSSQKVFDNVAKLARPVYEYQGRVFANDMALGATKTSGVTVIESKQVDYYDVRKIVDTSKVYPNLYSILMESVEPLSDIEKSVWSFLRGYFFELRMFNPDQKSQYLIEAVRLPRPQYVPPYARLPERIVGGPRFLVPLLVLNLLVAAMRSTLYCSST